MAPAKTGVTPPQGSPAASAVQPMGLQAQAQNLGTAVIEILHRMLPAYSPHDEQFKLISDTLQKFIKHFPRRSAPMPTPALAQAGGGGGGQMPMPQMSGGAPGGQVQRGPVPMPGR